MEALLPVLYNLWPDLDKVQTKVCSVFWISANWWRAKVQEDVNGMIGYFTLLKRALHIAPRPEVLDNLQPMFKVFMEAIDMKMVFGFTDVSDLRSHL